MARLLLIVLLSLFGLVACDNAVDTSASATGGDIGNAAAQPGDEDHATDAASIDQECRELLNEKGTTAEARDWLAAKHGNHMMWKGDKPRLRKLVDDLYSAGAGAVTVVDIHKEDAGELAAMFVITLPDAAPARKAVFKTINAFWTELAAEEEFEPDVKQKYLKMNLDL